MHCSILSATVAVCLWGVPAPGGGYLLGGAGGIPACTEADPHPCGQTHRCKNITFGTSVIIDWCTPFRVGASLWEILDSLSVTNCAVKLSLVVGSRRQSNFYFPINTQTTWKQSIPVTKSYPQWVLNPTLSFLLGIKGSLEAWVQYSLGVTFGYWILFCFHAVKPLMPTLELLPTLCIIGKLEWVWGWQGSEGLIAVCYKENSQYNYIKWKVQLWY